MSAMRHFRDENGWINSTEVHAGRYTNDPDFTEVQVAPLDAIVIRRDALPEVDPERPGFSGIVGLDGPGSADTEPVYLGVNADHLRKAREHLALAEYVAANPPVDPAQAKAIADVLSPIFEALGGCRDGWDVDDIAHEAARLGVRVEVTK